MNLLLFTGKEVLNNHIKNYHKDVTVSVCLHQDKLIPMTKEINPNRIIITSAAMSPHEDDTKSIILRLLKESQATIVFFYGTVENVGERDSFRNFLITKGIYNFFDGNIDADCIKESIYGDKTLNDWRSILSEIDTPITHTTASDQTAKPEVVEKIVVKTVENFVPVKQMVISLFGHNGKSVNGLHLAALLSKNFNLKTCFIDMNLKTPTISYYLNSSDPSFFKAHLDNIDGSYTPFKEFPKLHILNGVGVDAFNFNNPFVLKNDQIEDIVNMAKNRFDAVVIDTSGDLHDDMNRNIYRISNRRLFFTPLTYCHIEMIRSIQHNGYFKQNDGSFIILNQNKDDVFTLKEIKDTIRLDNVFQIDHFPNLTGKINKSELFLHDSYVEQLEAILSVISNLPISHSKKSFLKLFKRDKR